jgi:endonuclease/exonuclease/phosphatase (EEP) superfamily protein YafD
MLSVALLGATAGTVLGFAGGWWWAFDLFANFRLQYGFGLFGVLTGYALLRRWRPGAIAGAALVANLAVVVPLYLPAGTVPANTPRLRVVSFNANFGNDRFDDVAAALAGTDADVVLVTEATPPLEEALRRRMPGHALVGQSMAGAFGIVALTRLPVRTHRLLEVGGSGLQALELIVRLGDEDVAILGVHPPPPVGGALAGERDRQFRDVAAWANRQAGPVVIAGDLNATGWSYPFRELLADTSLHDSQRGFGLQPSWPAVPWPMAIAIDHCLHSPHFVTSARRVGERLGSDHRALHVTLALRRPHGTAMRTSTMGSLSSAR